mgnify:FL=1
MKPQINRKKNRGLKLQELVYSLRASLDWLFKGIKILPIIIVIFALIWGANYLFVKFNIPVNSVSVTGKFRYIEKKEVEKIILPIVSDGAILSLDLVQITTILEAHPWIEKVSVRRKWPGSIEINVTEEVPSARWGKTSFLNNQGEILEINNNDLSNLPLLQGVENSERQLMNTYREIVLLLQPVNLKITELKYDERGEWQIGLSNGLEILVGRDQIIEKIRRFLIIWMAVLNNRSSEIDGVDIRYDNGIAVRWK